MIGFPHLAQRLFNVPLAIRPDKAEIVMAALAERLGLSRLVRLDGATVALDAGAFVFDDDPLPRREAAYDTVAGVAVIPIRGTLVQRTGSLRPYSGMTGYDGIRQNFLVALEDPEVEAILLDIDSPGGEVSGCLDLAETIYQARGEKPIWAVLDDMACSAAYWLASAADRVTVPRTGVTGSIGVVCLHVDLSRALDKDGVTVRVIRHGAQKVESNPYEPPSDAVLGRLQGAIDQFGDLFDAAVARNRGMTIDAVRGLEAGVFYGEDGQRRGLADAVMAPDAAFRALQAELG